MCHGHQAYRRHEGDSAAVHVDEVRGVDDKLAHEGGEDVDAEDAGVGPLRGQGLQRLGSRDDEEESGRDHAVRGRLCVAHLQ